MRAFRSLPAVVVPLCVALAAPLALTAQTTAGAVVPLTASTHCASGVVYDDGFYEFHYATGGSGSGTFVQRLTLPAGTTRLDQVCVCLARLTSAGPTSVSLDIVVYADTGSGPGSLLGSFTTTATAIPIINGSGQFYDVDLSGADIAVSGSAYVGARWAGGGNVAVCGDRSASTPLRSTFLRQGSGPWFTVSSLFPSDPPRALAIRADAGTGGGGGGTPCVPGPNVMCLGAGDRFQVEATYKAGSNPQGTAHTVELTADTGYLWFFAAANVEAVVKVIDGCALNHRFWVFAGGLTDVRVTLKVTDTKNGTVKTWSNPQGTPFQPIQDTDAFATCP